MSSGGAEPRETPAEVGGAGRHGPGPGRHQAGPGRHGAGQGHTMRTTCGEPGQPRSPKETEAHLTFTLGAVRQRNDLAGSSGRPALSQMGSGHPRRTPLGKQSRWRTPHSRWVLCGNGMISRGHGAVLLCPRWVAIITAGPPLGKRSRWRTSRSCWVPRGNGMTSLGYGAVLLCTRWVAVILAAIMYVQQDTRTGDARVNRWTTQDRQDFRTVLLF
jgi:hypothetical protein